MLRVCTCKQANVPSKQVNATSKQVVCSTNVCTCKQPGSFVNKPISLVHKPKQTFTLLLVAKDRTAGPVSGAGDLTLLQGREDSPSTCWEAVLVCPYVKTTFLQHSIGFFMLGKMGSPSISLMMVLRRAGSPITTKANRPETTLEMNLHSEWGAGSSWVSHGSHDNHMTCIT